MTRSSPTPRKRVSPCAAAAATARTGTSSSDGDLARAATVAPESADDRATSVARAALAPSSAQARAHAREHADEADALAGVVDVRHHDLGVAREQRRHHEERRLRRVARDLPLAGRAVAPG